MSILPSVRPTLNLQFDKQPTPEAMLSHLKSVGATFDRGAEASQIATYVDSKGVIQLAPANYPRPDYDLETGEHKGLLIEEGRTNHIAYSEDINNAAWLKSNVTISATNGTAPDGTSTAHRVQESSDGASQTHFIEEAISGVDATLTYTVSYFLFPSGREQGTIRVRGNGTGNGFGVQYNLTNETVSAISNFGTGSYSSSTIKKTSKGFYRITVTGVPATSGTGISTDLRLRDDSSNESYIGNGSDGVYVWGVQAEEGSFPTSYIPTAGSALTRAAEKCYIDGTDFTDFYNQSEGLMLIEGLTNYSASSFRLFTLSDGTNDNRIAGTGFNNGQLGVFLNNEGVTQVNESVAVTSLFKLAYKLIDNGIKVFSAGTEIISDTSCTLPKNLTKLGIGISPSNTIQLNGHIKRLLYFPKALTDTELKNLTRNL